MTRRLITPCARKCSVLTCCAGSGELLLGRRSWAVLALGFWVRPAGAQLIAGQDPPPILASRTAVPANACRAGNLDVAFAYAAVFGEARRLTRPRLPRSSACYVQSNLPADRSRNSARSISAWDRWISLADSQRACEPDGYQHRAECRRDAVTRQRESAIERSSCPAGRPVFGSFREEIRLGAAFSSLDVSGYFPDCPQPSLWLRSTLAPRRADTSDAAPIRITAHALPESSHLEERGIVVAPKYIAAFIFPAFDSGFVQESVRTARSPLPTSVLPHAPPAL